MTSSTPEAVGSLSVAVSAIQKLRTPAGIALTVLCAPVGAAMLAPKGKKGLSSGLAYAVMFIGSVAAVAGYDSFHKQTVYEHDTSEVSVVVSYETGSAYDSKNGFSVPNVILGFTEMSSPYLVVSSLLHGPYEGKSHTQVVVSDHTRGVSCEFQENGSIAPPDLVHTDFNVKKVLIDGSRINDRLAQQFIPGCVKTIEQYVR